MTAQKRTESVQDVPISITVLSGDELNKRGPQGTLYGRNTPIGALNITTRKPGNEFESMICAGYSEYNQATLSGYIGGGCSDSASGRLSFWSRDREGFEENTFTGNDVNDNSEWGLRDTRLPILMIATTLWMVMTRVMTPPNLWVFQCLMVPG